MIGETGIQIFIVFVALFGWSLALDCINTNRLNESKEVNEKKTITIGFLGSFKYGLTLGKLIAGAIPLAVDEVNKYVNIYSKQNNIVLIIFSVIQNYCQIIR